MPSLGLLPFRQRRKAHQDRVDVAAGLEAEQSPAVVEQVELDVAAAKFEQPVHVGVVERRIHPLAHQSGEDVEECLANVPRKGEIGVEGRALARLDTVEMVIENAADTARDSAMR